MKQKRAKYDPEMPRKLYVFFRSYDEREGAPSYQKFAAANGLTLADLERFRKHPTFDEAYRAAGEIRRDYLIDHALSRRFDPSFVKYLLSEELGAAEGEEDRTLDVRVTVCD